ncbi:hypothetical protein EST38_g1036 [Candolleomyces aberdarensis]|uniref:Uncharacterized protein n=1 Tax=Candolleomyces aberdarensis TaxID=2316362 RepID=A0A4Q2DY53_9AGAR|nr:hypothetical protein EST38_g1036 [Candolleomyces aberdarensis]
MDFPESGYLAGANTFSGLTHISISGGSPALYDCVFILSQCTSAVQAEFGTIAAPPYDPNPGNYTSIAQVNRTCLPELRSLTLVASSDVEAFLPHFECPGLLRLLMSNGPIDLTGEGLQLSNYHFPAVQAFLSRAPDLKQVVIVNNVRWKDARMYFSPKHCRAILDIPAVDVKARLPRGPGQRQNRELPSNDLGFRVCNHGKQAFAHVRKGEIGNLPDLEQAGTPFWNETDDIEEWMVPGCPTENEAT